MHSVHEMMYLDRGTGLRPFSVSAVHISAFTIRNVKAGRKLVYFLGKGTLPEPRPASVAGLLQC